jgi:hypothetical protein
MAAGGSGVILSIDRGSHHPLPPSPIEGEVLSGGCGWIVPLEWRETSPLMGEARRGWGHALDLGVATP